MKKSSKDGLCSGYFEGGGQSGEVVSLEDYLRSGPVPGAKPQKQVRQTTSVTKRNR